MKPRTNTDLRDCLSSCSKSVVKQDIISDFRISEFVN